MSAPASVLVVGASAAGLATAEALRRKGFKGRLQLLGAEAHLPYDRPPLSKQVLSGRLGPRAGAAAARDDAVRSGHRVGARRSGRGPRRPQPRRQDRPGARTGRRRDRDRHRHPTARVPRQHRARGRAPAAHHGGRARSAHRAARLAPPRGGRRRRARGRDRRHRNGTGRARSTLVGPAGRADGAAARVRWSPNRSRSCTPNAAWTCGQARASTASWRRTAGSPASAWPPARSCRRTLVVCDRAGPGDRLARRVAGCGWRTASSATRSAVRPRGSGRSATSPAGITWASGVHCGSRTARTPPSRRCAVAANILGERQPYMPVPYFWTDQFDAKIQVYGPAEQRRRSRSGGRRPERQGGSCCATARTAAVRAIARLEHAEAGAAASRGSGRRAR